MSLALSSDPQKNLLWKYVIFGFIFASIITLFSLIMSGVAFIRGEIVDENYINTGMIYNGPLEQSAPSLRVIEPESDLFIMNRLDPITAKRYVDNTFLTKTAADVVIDAEFVKKGLTLQPTFRTSFEGAFTLENKLKEKSVVTFVFPLPVSGETNELSNARLVVNGEKVENAKTKIDLTDEYGYITTVDGLEWEGEIGPNASKEIKASYNTVGLSFFTYEGIENSKGSQDVNFTLTINGTRSYNVVEGLSVDKREFGDNYVKLAWKKTDLFSKPLIKVSVGERLNPSSQVSRVYLTMAPIYVVFFAILLFTAYRFGKTLGIFDMFLLSVLFTVFFPLVHYLSSFTIDPTMEVFATIPNVTEFSMPLHGAFALAWALAGGLMYYLIVRMTSFKYATMLFVPMLVLFMGFFPLVVTIPEYSMLLVILGFVALMAIIIQVRIRLHKQAKS